MKASSTIVALALAALGVAMPVAAQHQHGTVAAVGGTSASVTYVDGVVKRIDKAGGRVTIAHDPITNLDMPRMTMTFRVRDAHWLEQMKEGAHIRFAAESPNGVLTVVAYQPG